MKRVVAMLIAPVLCLAITACSGGGPPAGTEATHGERTRTDSDEAVGIGNVPESEEPDSMPEGDSKGDGDTLTDTIDTTDPLEPKPSPKPTEHEALPDTMLTDAYRAYFNILSEAVDLMGIGIELDPDTYDYETAFNEWSEKASRGVYAGEGLLYAELICFGDNALPQLLYIYDTGYGPGRYICYIEVYGYTSRAEQFFSSHIGGDAGDYIHFDAVYDQNGTLFFRSIDSHENEASGDEAYVTETYYTVSNGMWIEVPETEINAAGVRNFEYIPETVRSVLVELQSLCN